ncbi:hypothetical protein GCM10007301_12670 [Azorhizobium oxalatiphilum]|uniref:Sel1 repeat family protein n=1 Tax=Azorhizobium oxalatiphilum TaxID=980631 RepID=A0A917F5V9_9HYPH|nr:tetratricopeptide repeat protein [Azorhizobium oxalatiphilum]GGF54623.1 hypothetical protein GCM10007301_12670 [Azorhizobium oxalatiphilum]
MSPDTPTPDAGPQGATLGEAQLALGQVALERGDHAAALDWFGIAARNGDARGYNMLGRCHERGWGVPVDAVKAVAYFRHAADLGDDWGLFNLADALARGAGCARDDAAAYDLYVQAARKGQVRALNMLGLFHEEGRAVALDLATARQFFRAGAEGGDPWAQFNLARSLMAEGNKTEGVAWLERSLVDGFPVYWQSLWESLLGAADPALRALAEGARARLAGTTASAPASATA